MKDRNFKIPAVSLVFVNIERLINGEEKLIQELKSNAEQGLEVKCLSFMICAFIRHLIEVK